MRRGIGSLLSGLALTTLAPAALASPSQANPGYTFVRTPSHGKPGTVIHSEGTGCEYEGKPYDFAAVYLHQPGQDTLAQERYDIADDGSFSGDLTVPADARAGKYLLSAECYASDMAFVVADTYFTVDGPPSPSPTPTTPSPRPTPSRTPTLRPSTTRTPSPRPTPSRTTARALPSPTPPVVAPSPSSVASSQPADPPRNPSALLVMAAVALIAANGLGIRAAVRPPSRR